MPYGKTTSAIEKVLNLPGQVMTTVDGLARTTITKAGFTEAEAREMIFTSVPFTKDGQSGVTFQRSGGALVQTHFPFARSPINVAEQGALLLPGT